MLSFTDIGQFREVIKAVRINSDYKGKDAEGNAIYLHDALYPAFRFRGTVKLHGTNAGIILYADGRYEFQSRERTLSLTQDNANFMLSTKSKPYESLFDGIKFKEHCAIYGEWCGRNIQKGIAISQLEKMFIIFAVRIDNVYQDLENFKHLKNEEQRIFNILQFEHYYLDINFEAPQMVQNTLVEYTQKVEEQCPVGKYFGAVGCGEGIVWEYISGTTRYIFKVKGEKHQNSKVKTLTTVDTEELKNIAEFIEYAVTENRMKQGIDKMRELGKPIDPTTTGDYLRWIFNDVIKEEEDTLVKNGIPIKKIGSAISAKARIFWLNYLNIIVV